MFKNSQLLSFIGDKVKLTLSDGSVLNGAIVPLGITRGVAIQPNLSSSANWPFRAEDVVSIERV
jgi:hypothetical protein